MNKHLFSLDIAELYALVAMVRCDINKPELIRDYLEDMDSIIEGILEELEK